MGYVADLLPPTAPPPEPRPADQLRQGPAVVLAAAPAIRAALAVGSLRRALQPTSYPSSSLPPHICPCGSVSYRGTCLRHRWPRHARGPGPDRAGIGLRVSRQPPAPGQCRLPSRQPSRGIELGPADLGHGRYALVRRRGPGQFRLEAQRQERVTGAPTILIPAAGCHGQLPAIWTGGGLAVTSSSSCSSSGCWVCRPH